MLRLVLLGSAAALCAGAGSALAGGEPGPFHRHAPLPPEIAYRDPAYVPAPPRPVVVVVHRAPRSLALPLYNEPPPRFPVP